LRSLCESQKRRWVPWQLPTARVALLSDRGVTASNGNVSAWTDVVTGSGVAAVMASAPAQPTISGNVISFADGHYLRTANNVLNVPTPSTMYLVASSTYGPGNSRTYVDGWQAGERACVLIYGTDGTLIGNSGTNNLKSAALVPSGRNIIACTFGSAGSLCINSATTVAASGDSGSQVCKGLTIGASYAAAATVAGSLEAVMLFAGPRDARIVWWLSRSYGIAIS
jgi:hypothetical protein